MPERVPATGREPLETIVGRGGPSPIGLRWRKAVGGREMSAVRTGAGSTDAHVADRVPEVVDGIERLKLAVVENTEDKGTRALVEEVWDVVEEIEDVLETVDLREVPDVIDSEVMIELLASSEVPGKVLSGESVDVRELLTMRDAVDLREVWKAVDLGRFLGELRELKAEVDDLRDEGGDGDSAGADRAAPTGSRRPNAHHSTAVSTLSRAPLPASVSRRVSTVPSRVRRSRRKPPRRIGGGRFDRARTE
jgi:hypothetical protein